jgi:hypothetical protein
MTRRQFAGNLNTSILYKRISIRRTAFVLLTFTLLLLGTAYMQSHLKFKPQLVMLSLGTAAVLGYLLGLRKASTIFFGILLSLLLYINFFLLYIRVLTVAGNAAPLMEIGAMVFSLVLSSLTVSLYFWKFKREAVTERYCAIGFLILTLAVFMIYEIRVFN